MVGVCHSMTSMHWGRSSITRFSPRTRKRRISGKAAGEAIKYNCAAFYSASRWTPIVKEELAGTDILIGTGIDFPGAFGLDPQGI